jgi:8-oxo-dGTP pyrophosphatase MutT (NUDIX family)
MADEAQPDLRIRKLFPGGHAFQMRIAGLAFREGHLLVHRAVHENFWTIPGGRAEVGEASEDTLVREMSEELGVKARVDRLLWMVENFFHYEERSWHELGLYYLMHLPETFPFASEEIIHRVEDGGNQLEFKWVEATTNRLKALDIPPYFLADQIEDLPLAPKHICWVDGNLDLI